uniref:Rhodanese domain-containing protein n=1 Tax=viral metagenome TaxID=1070528 RepID=A0A6C0AZA9_9ZZZZ|tara:strand:+ start:40911 stop:41318 length:408 start_codon:yes stop_codon:yes gene_type:complete
MGNINSLNSIKKINFEDLQLAIKKNNYIIINTLNDNNQECLIKGTITPEQEVQILNEYLNKSEKIVIIIYGENSNDEKIFLKYKQLIDLGFNNVYLYIGGMFEWLMLQEIYGEENFPTTTRLLDLLKYKPVRNFE